MLTPVVFCLLWGHDLPVNSPAGIVAFFNGVEEILDPKVGILAGLYDSFLVGVVFDPLVRDRNRPGAGSGW